MKSTLLSLAWLAATAAATTTTAASSASTCAAEYIVQACLTTENAQFSNCGDNDWDCKCNAYSNIVTCYNNCPDDAALYQAAGQKQIFCAYASQYPSTTAAATSTASAANKAKASGSDTATTTTAAATTTAGKTTATTSKTGTATKAAETNAGADLAVHAGSFMAAVAGMVAAVL